MPLKDKKQLFGQMMFNVSLNNTDDHLRNFSFSCKESGWQLTPAYDVVPSTTFGNYHQLKLGYDDILPSYHQALNFHSQFGLTKHQALQVITDVESAMLQWQTVFKDCGVSDKDIKLLSKLIRS